MSYTLDENLNVIADGPVEIQLLNGDLAFISKLDDEPNDVGGMTAAELKAEFDKAGLTIQKYLNETLVPKIIADDLTEKTRAESEADRVASEAARKEAEFEREVAEDYRSRKSNEQAAAENIRVQSEKKRVAAEEQRVEAEAKRVSSTEGVVARATEQAVIAANSASAAAANAQSAAESKTAAAQSVASVAASEYEVERHRAAVEELYGLTNAAKSAAIDAQSAAERSAASAALDAALAESAQQVAAEAADRAEAARDEIVGGSTAVWLYGAREGQAEAEELYEGGSFHILYLHGAEDATKDSAKAGHLVIEENSGCVFRIADVYYSDFTLLYMFTVGERLGTIGEHIVTWGDIKERPFGEERIYLPVVPETELQITNGMAAFVNKRPLEVGKLYAVMFNGVEYLCEASVFAENPRFIALGGALDPFQILYDTGVSGNYEISVYAVDGAVPKRVLLSVDEVEIVISKIDEKFLPEGVGDATEQIKTALTAHNEDEEAHPILQQAIRNLSEDTAQAFAEAEQAQDKATQAYTLAESADSKAGAAQTSASAAQATADEAKTAAATAQATADEAKTAAATAQATADEAKTAAATAQATADEAKATADGNAKDIVTMQKVLNATVIVAEETADEVAEIRKMLEDLPEGEGGSGGSADWAQNNPLGSGYVKNRTHWVEDIGTDVLLPETSVSFSGSRSAMISGVSSKADSLSTGDTVLVVWNGKEYVCACFKSSGYPALGNGSLIEGSGDENTGEPFLITFTYNGDATVFKKTSVSETFTLEIGGEVLEYHKLDGRYLPEGTPWVEEGEAVYALPETTLDTKEDTFGGFPILDVIDVQVGDERIVNYNGTDYLCTAGATVNPQGVPIAYFGDLGALTGAPTGSHPFFIAIASAEVAAAMGMGGMVVPLDGSTVVTVSIRHYDAGIAHKLDSRCLPDGLPRLFNVHVTADIYNNATVDKSFAEIMANANDDNVIVRAIVSVEGDATKAVAQLTEVSESRIRFFIPVLSGSTHYVNFITINSDGTVEANTGN